MIQQPLHLIEVATCLAAELGAGPPQIVGREFPQWISVFI
jgi:hypothetical protein